MVLLLAKCVYVCAISQAAIKDAKEQEKAKQAAKKVCRRLLLRVTVTRLVSIHLLQKMVFTTNLICLSEHPSYQRRAHDEKNLLLMEFPFSFSFFFFFFFFQSGSILVLTKSILPPGHLDQVEQGCPEGPAEGPEGHQAAQDQQALAHEPLSSPFFFLFFVFVLL